MCRVTSPGRPFILSQGRNNRVRTEHPASCPKGSGYQTGDSLTGRFVASLVLLEQNADAPDDKWTRFGPADCSRVCHCRNWDYFTSFYCKYRKQCVMVQCPSTPGMLIWTVITLVHLLEQEELNGIYKSRGFHGCGSTLSSDYILLPFVNTSVSIASHGGIWGRFLLLLLLWCEIGYPYVVCLSGWTVCWLEYPPVLPALARGEEEAPISLRSKRFIHWFSSRIS